MNSPVIRLKLPNSLPTLLALYPIAWAALLYLFVVRTRLALGHWPAPYQPDPKTLVFNLHYQAIVYGLLALPLVAILTLLLAIAGRRTAVYHRVWPTLTLLGCSLLFVIALCWFDPGDFIEWFAD